MIEKAKWRSIDFIVKVSYIKKYILSMILSLVAYEDSILKTGLFGFNRMQYLYSKIY
jgi:hypothetical protein